MNDISVEHIAHRPSWDCRACGMRWPCDPAREAMRKRMDETPLAIYLWLCFEEAVEQLPTMRVEEALDRFINWSRIPR